jgi:hypothetical protein
MIRKIKGVTPKDMEAGVKRLFAFLYLEDDGEHGVQFNPEKEWDSASDYLEDISELVRSLVEWVPARKGKK